MNYTMKNLKSWDSIDGVGWEASLYRDGTKLGRIKDEGNGGCLQISISEIELDTLNEYTATNKGDIDMFLAALADETETQGKVKRVLARKVYFVTEDNQLKMSKNKMSDAIRSQILQQFPNAVILNDAPIEKAMEYMAA